MLPTTTSTTTPPSVRRLLATTFLAALLLAAAGCGRGEAPAGPPPTPEQLGLPSEAEVEERRAERSAAIATLPDSPIPAERREGFEGLAFYPFDPALRFVVRLEEYDDPEPVVFETTTGGQQRPAVRAGQVRFDYQGATRTLQVYQLRDQGADAWESLFLPFMDETTGLETYGAGRYLNLVKGPDGWYGLDFNLAYLPDCAYGRTDYVCPRTPPENRLDVPIRAGQRGGVDPAGAPEAATGTDESPAREGEG